MKFRKIYGKVWIIVFHIIYIVLMIVYYIYCSDDNFEYEFNSI